MNVKLFRVLKEDHETHLDTLILDELDSQIRVLQLLRSQFGMLLVFAEIFSANNFEKLHQVISVLEIVLHCVNVHISLLQLSINPIREGLQEIQQTNGVSRALNYDKVQCSQLPHTLQYCAASVVDTYTLLNLNPFCL